MIINIFLTTTKSKEKASSINAKGYLFRKDFLKLVTLGIFPRSADHVEHGPDCFP